MKKLFISLFLVFSVLTCLSQSLEVNNRNGSQNLNFDIRNVPFSYRGSYLTVSGLVDYFGYNQHRGADPDGLILRNITKGGWSSNESKMIIKPVDNDKFDFSWVKATPSQIEVKNSRGLMEICFENKNVLRFSGKKFPIAFTPLNGGSLVILNERQFRIWPYGNYSYMFTILKGQMKYSGEGGREVDCYGKLTITVEPDTNGDFDLAVEEFYDEWVPRSYTLNFNQCMQNTSKVFNQWLLKFPPVKPEYVAARDLAAYIQWSSLVSARGLNKREAGLVSKNWYVGIWNWDHCHSAIGLALSHPDVAWNDYVCMFDHQSEMGSFPDLFNDFSEMWNYHKPSVYGWVLKYMLHNSNLVNDSLLRSMYIPLKHLSEFWLKYRANNGNSLPQFYNSSEGWDVSTPYDAGLPLETPELAAFLIVQMDLLAEIAQKTGLSNDADLWKNRSDKMLELLISRLWTGEKFVSKRTGTDIYNQNSECLNSYEPLILGEKLPLDIRRKMIARLKQEGEFLTPYGLSYESLKSPGFDLKVYTRHNIWSHHMMVIIDGLIACGEDIFAKEVAKRYCDHLAKNGFSEMINSLTGENENDPAYAATAGVYLTLVQTVLK